MCDWMSRTTDSFQSMNLNQSNLKPLTSWVLPVGRNLPFSPVFGWCQNKVPTRTIRMTTFHCSCFYMCGSEAGRFRQSYTFQPRFASCGTQGRRFLGTFPLSQSNSLVVGKRPVEAPWKLISMRRRLCALPCWMVFGI